ncbi:dUTP diphosphatase [Chenggangzhangella methanolivorans]|uniref:Deoxyuridine 5'-triphosphate nucleotidohydrolase n=1 Tax=Chenggangzhangella methanolivorans TaxID=1437009 RepID=A0A9E6ULK0_9HYPH|nr:dUTP diphosphatase [Chenggangzhangella methanolivorans]QZN98293.1 dUTP diphosphatase [Chenggangzhangella methanolivorans]
MSGPSVVPLNVLRLPHAEGLAVPSYESDGAAGMDLRAAVPEDHPIMIAPGGRALVPTGLSLQFPYGYEAQVRPRSGLALRHGVTVLNSPGTVDADYRGEVKVVLVNLGDEPFVVERGARIAQLVMAAVARAEIVEVTTLDPSRRGAGGFGSTGT